MEGCCSFGSFNYKKIGAMEYLLIYDRKKPERELIVQKLHDYTAFFSDEQLVVEEYAKAESVTSYIEGNNALDLAVMEIKQDTDVKLARTLRETKKRIEMMLVAEASVSPMDYLTPEVRACSLLLRPCSQEQISQVVKSFMGSYYSSRQKSMNEPSILIENRQGKTIVPCSEIYYVEVRGKKVYIRLQDKEYAKYESLENILKVLPDYFLQSHRSFVFNTRLLERVKLSENMLYLEHGITVPLSRSYKAQIKEFMDGNQHNI